MARSLTWSPEAIEDIESIVTYIERDSLWYAKVVASRIIETAETIPEYPEIGRVVPEIGDVTIRERFVYSYRIIYRVETDRVLVVAIIHGSRLLQPFTQRNESGSESDL